MASHRANSRHLAGLPGRLTRRLFTTFHSAPLPVGPATSRTPTAPPKRTEAAALPPARAAKPPYRSTALHCVKTAETGDSPGQRITSPSYGNARKLAGLRCGLVMRRPPKFVWHLAGQANSSLLPFLLSLPEQKPKDRDPAPLDTKPIRCWTCTPRQESGQLLLRLRCSFLRVWAYAELPALTAAPNVSLTSGRPCSALGLKACPVVADC